MKKRILSLALVLSLVLVFAPTVMVEALTNQSGASIVPVYSNKSSTIAAGSYYNMVIKEDGSLWAWGDNYNGYLGDGTNIDRLTPVKVMDDVVAVSAMNHTMAIKKDGSLWAWGSNHCGVIGDGTATVYDYYGVGSILIEGHSKNSPVHIMDNVVAVSASSRNSYVIKTDGSLWAWGDNEYGQIGDGTRTVIEYKFGKGKDETIIDNNRRTPVKVMDNVASFSSSGSSCFAIKKDGSLWAWGSNLYSELGNGEGGNDNHINNRDNNCSPVPAKVMDGIAVVSAGLGHTMAIKNDGSLWAWGYNYYGQIGDGTWQQGELYKESIKKEPVKIMDNVISACASSQNSYAIKTDGSLWAWGYNYYGGIGDGTDTDRATPVKVMGDVVTISADDRHALALKTDGSLWTWGKVMKDARRADNSFETEKLNPTKVMDGVKLPINALVPNNTPVDPIDTASNWARDGINSAVAKGFVPQDLQNNYKNVITRAEFCRMAVKYIEYATGKSIDAVLTEKGVTRSPNAFTDTSDTDILAAFALGITSGTANSIFSPNGQITREQAATMITNVCKVLDKNAENTPASNLADIGSASSWALDSINYCFANGIMNGTGNNNFSPKATYTREQSILTFNNIK